MRSSVIQTSKHLALSALILFGLANCERSDSDLKTLGNPVNPNVFIDTFSAGLNYAAFGGSVPAAFQVDTEVAFNGTRASMRFDVPNENDPRGAYAGGAFFTSGPRDLSGFDALTFWARASQAVDIDVIGFGNDLGANRFQAAISGVPLTTSWQKIIIPLPDPERLTGERGMLFYSTGPVNGRGYTFWMDEVKFEKLGTIAHPQAAILNGQTQTTISFIGVGGQIGGLQSRFNLPNGTNLSVDAASAYFDFESSNPATATVDEQGRFLTVGTGSTTITASLKGVPAVGSITVQSQGVFTPAPTPPHAAADVISIFSDVYPNHPVNYFNGFWEFSTTGSADFTVNGDNVLNYTNFNFVGIEFSSPTVNASSMTHLRMSIFIPATLQPGVQFRIELVDFGADGVFGGGNDRSHTLTFTAATNPAIVGQQWITFDIPLANFTTLTSRANLAQIIFSGTNIPGFYADNIYFRR